jgi:hypothetical protein
MKGIWKENGKWWQFSITNRGYTIKPYISEEDKKPRTIGIKKEWKPLDGQQQFILDKER